MMSTDILPMHHLFSPTIALDHDLKYVDKTYYILNGTTSEEDEEEEISSTAQHDANDAIIKSEKYQHSSLHAMVLNKTISLVHSISRLDLRNIGLFVLPTQISLLTKLTLLDLSHNKLVKLPSTMDQLKHLKYLNLSHNNLTHLPTSIYSLTKLTHFELSFNPFTYISANLARLVSLNVLDLSNTEINCIPAELLNLSMTTIKLDDCPLDLRQQQSLEYDAMSLIEQCARQLIQPILYQVIVKNNNINKKKKNKKKQQFEQLPNHLIHYLSKPKACSSCGGPYFNHCVTRYRMVQRMDESWVPVEYKLCTAHWNNEQERILSLFADLPNSSLPMTSEPCRLKLVG